MLAITCIAIWGFTGSWEYPELESVTLAADRSAQRIEREAPADAAGPQAAPAGLASTGEQLFEANGCYACHSIDGERKIGPSLLAIYGKPAELADGSSVLVDDAYLMESILHPQAKLVAGFEEAAMPSYEGMVDEQDAVALSAYIKSLR